MLNPSVPARGPLAGPAAAVAHSQPMTHTQALAREEGPSLTVQAVSRMLGVAAVTVYRLAARRALPAYRFLRRLRFRREDVLVWLESKKVAPSTPDVWRSGR